jgi:TonB family protein
MVRDERPPSLLAKKPIDASTVILGLAAALGAHVAIPAFLLASQWLLVLLGIAIESHQKPPVPPPSVIAAEFVKLGKPFDPTKLPNRKVPPIAKRRPDGVVVSKDAQDQPEKPKEEEKEKPPDSQESLLDNLVERSKDFAEDIEPLEEEGDPNGIREGTATEAKAGDIYRGQLAVFFRRNFSVPNVVQNPEKKRAIVAVVVASDGVLRSAEVSRSSGDPLFDQAALDAAQALIQSGASLPEPPLEMRDQYYGTTQFVEYTGEGLR